MSSTSPVSHNSTSFPILNQLIGENALLSAISFTAATISYVALNRLGFSTIQVVSITLIPVAIGAFALVRTGIGVFAAAFMFNYIKQNNHSS